MKIIFIFLFFCPFSIYCQTQNNEDDFDCEDIIISIDKFDSSKRYFEKSYFNISVTKYVKKDTINDTSYYLNLFVYGSTINLNIKGVYILFSDGSKIEYPNEKIKLDYDNGYKYSAFFKIDNTLLEKLKNLYINDFKLYIYEMNFEKKYFIRQQNKFKKNLKCMLEN